MNNIWIVVDSAADLGQDVLQKPHMAVLPLKVRFGEREYRDGVDLTHRTFYELLIENDELPKTSQINAAEFADVLAPIVAAGDEALVITLSSKLSGTYQSACLAAQEFGDHVRVVDSLQVTIGEHILVQYAQTLREQGLTLAQLHDKVLAKRGDIEILALLDTLEYLKKGGRIGKTAAVAGELLSIKPVITLKEGEVQVVGKARGSKNGSNLLVQLIQNAGGVDFSLPFRLGYTGLDTTLLQKYIADSRHLWQAHTAALPIGCVGSAIGTHVGPGAIAVAFFRK